MYYDEKDYLGSRSHRYAVNAIPEESIRKAVSLGGDSDTLACITGGIAEAFYGGVPGEISATVQRRLPSQFLEILRRMKEKTSYDFSPIE